MPQRIKQNLIPLLTLALCLLLPQILLAARCGSDIFDCDGDGVIDTSDNCYDIPNGPDAGTCVGQTKSVNCTLNSTCDPTFPYTAFCSTDQEDEDGDGIGDACDPCRTVHTDLDADDDCVPDSEDGCVNDPDKTSPGTCGCGIPETDTDGDGTPDCTDNCPSDSSKTEPGVCGCGSVDLTNNLCSTGSALPDTGQQKCYNNFSELIPCPTSAEAFFGQDGTYQINTPSFTKLDGDGNILADNAPSWRMVRDNVTGLIWHIKDASDGVADIYGGKHDPDNTYFWCQGAWEPAEDYPDYNGECSISGILYDTGTYVHALYGMADLTWRLPTVKELSRLLQSIESTPMLHSFFVNIPEDAVFWADNTDKQNVDNAWTVDFSTISGKGKVQPADKSLHYYAMAVSGSKESRHDNFTNNQDGTVTDKNTGLMWLIEPADADHNGLADDMTLEESLNWAENLTTNGHDDWRLPNRSELQSLIDYKRYEPALATAFFPDVYDDNTNPLRRFWSSTTSLASDNSILGTTIEFVSGKVTTAFKTQHYNARAVRGGTIHEEGKIAIAVPAQGEILYIGVAGENSSTSTIKWNPGAVPQSEDVYIYLSTDGGKTFTTISYQEGYNVPNSGSYSWDASGINSDNCVIKIVPVNPAYEDLSGVQELFSIRQMAPTYRISYQYFGSDFSPAGSHYKVSLASSQAEGIVPATTGWQITAGTDIAEYSDFNQQVGANYAYFNNGWFQLSTQLFNTIDYTRYLFLVPDWDATEGPETENSSNPAYGNDNASNADIITVGNFYGGTLSTPADIDYYTFQVSADATVHLGFLYRANDYHVANTRIEVIAVDTGEIIASTVTDEISILSLGLTTGQYYVRLTAADTFSSYTTYALSFTIDPAATYQDNSGPPTPLTPSTATTGIINTLVDSASYSFEVPETSAMEVSFAPVSDTADYHIEIRNDLNEVLHDVSVLNQQPVTLSGIFDQGSYTIIITPLNTADASNPFNLKIRNIDKEFELEPNNSSATANTLVKDNGLSGKISSDTDQDFYTFTLEAPSYLNLSLYCPISNKDFTMTLYKGSVDNQIDAINTTGGDDVSLHMGLSVGTYFLRVTPSGDAETVYYYTLLLQDSLRSSLEVEANNTIRFANTIEADIPRTGRIYSATDVDHFGFGLTPDSGTADIHVHFASYSASAAYRVAIVDVNLNELDSATSTGGSDLVLNASVPVGNYYVKIEAAGTVDLYTHYELQVSSSNGTIAGLKSIVAVQVSGDTGEMMPGDPDMTLTAEAFYSNTVPAAYASPSFDWLSLDPAVATVNSAGVVTAVATGTTSIVASHPDITDVVGRFDLVIGNAEPGLQHHGNLILVGGGGPDETDNLYASTKYLSELVYSRFQSRFFSDDDIYFLSPTASHDINGDGFNDDIVDDPTANPTLAKFSTAVSSWAAASERNTDGPLYIYLLDHGSNDNFKINSGQYLTSTTLKNLLDAFQTTTGRQVVVMIEACKSGTFVSGPAVGNLVNASENRVVVTSTDDLDTYIQLDGRISFSQFFVDRLLTGDTIREAYDSATLRLSTMGLPYTVMAPQLALGTGSNADQLILGGDFGIGSLFPEFMSVSSGIRNIAANSLQNFSAEIADLDAVEKVWAMVRGPDYQVPDISAGFEAPEVKQEVIQYLKSGLQHTGNSTNFRYNGSYTVSCYAMNANGNVSQAPQNIALTVTGGLYLPGDINGNSVIDLTDAIVAMQELVGITTGELVGSYPTSGADTNDDGKLGLAEVISIMQTVAKP